jgi:phage-related protein
MSREFTMGIRLNYMDNSFSKGIREATRHTDSFRDGLARASTGADGFIGKLGGLAVALGGIAAAKKSFDWLVGANADMEQYQNTLTVVMKSQEEATKTLAWANKFAAKTPFEIPQVVAATTRMSAYGISAQKTLGIVGDMASVMGKDLMQAVEAVADAQTGELERLKEFGITKKMIQDQAKLLGANPIDSKGSITDVKAFNAVLFSLMEDRFKGGMEMQSKSWKGMVSNAKDFMASMGRNLGKPLFDRSKKQLEGFLNTLNRLQSDGSIDRFVSQVHKVGAVVGNEMAYAGKVVRGTFRGIWAVASPIINEIRSNWAKWQPVIQMLGYSMAAFAVGLSGVKTAITAASIAMRLLSAAMLTNPIGWIILGVGLLVGWFIKMNGGIAGATKKVKGFVDEAVGLFKGIKEVFKTGTTEKFWDMGFGPKQREKIVAVVNGIKKAAAVIGSVFSFLYQKASLAIGWIVTNWPKIQSVIVGAFMAVYNIVAPVIGLILSNIVNAFTMVAAWFMKYWPGIQRLFILFWAWIGPYVMAILQVIWSIVKNGFMLVMSIIKNVWLMVTGIIQIAWGIISGILGVGLALLVGDWGGAWDAMLGMLTNVWDGIKKFFTGLGGLFYDSGKAIISTLVDGIKAMAMAPVNAIKNVLGKVRDFLPFSDAKKGPLSELTYSGGAVMTTLATGVNKQQGALQKAVTNAFAGTTLGMSVSATATGQQMAPAASFSAAGTNIAPAQVNAVAATSAPQKGNISVANLVGEIHIHAQPGDDAENLVDQVIDQLYSKVEEVIAILSSADKAVLI